MNPITDLGNGVRVLSNPYEVDGRVSWHADGIRGWASANCLLLQDGADALLLDTGLTIHRDAFLAQLHSLLAEGDHLELFMSRLGEFDSICCMLDVIEDFNVRKIYAAFADAPEWGDMHPARRLADVPGGEEVRTKVLDRSHAIELVPGRVLQVVRPSLRNLSTYWVYDPVSRTMFTGDSFCYAIATGPDGPWVVDGQEVADEIQVSDVKQHLLTGSRFWWLADSRLGEIREEIADIFSRHEVDAIVPSFGRVIKGDTVVRRHVELLDLALEDIERNTRKAAA